jgi:hypothetical protein
VTKYTIMFKWYLRAVEKNPLLLNVVSGFFLAFGGDVFCQTQFESGKGVFYKDEKVAAKWEWNEGRSWELGVLRATLLGPWTHIYYPWLARVIPGPHLKHAMMRAGLDQFVGSPVVICLAWFGSDIYNGRYNDLNSLASNVKLTVGRIIDQGPNAWLGGAKFWPFVHTINFRFVPQLHQPMFAHFFSIYWNAILSFYNNRANLNLSAQDGAKKEEKKEESQEESQAVCKIK